MEDPLKIYSDVLKITGESVANEFDVGPNLICPVCYKEIDAGNNHLDYDNKTVSWAGKDTYPQFHKLEQHIEQEHTPDEFGVQSMSDYNNGWIGNNLFDATSNSVGGGILDDVTLYNVDSTGTAGVGIYNSQGHGRLDDNQGSYKCPNCRSGDLYNKSGRNYGEDVYCASCNWQGTIRDVVVESIANEVPFSDGINTWNCPSCSQTIEYDRQTNEIFDHLQSHGYSDEKIRTILNLDRSHRSEMEWIIHNDI